jgi:hypothetical protein
MRIPQFLRAGLPAIAGTALFVFPLTAVSQEQSCAPRDAWLSELAGPKWQEEVSGLGLVRNREGENVGIIELFLSADGKTFSILATEPRRGGMWSCLIASGHDWASYAPLAGAPL